MRLSINKWAVLTATGATSTLGYGVSQLLIQPLQEAKHLPLPKILFSNEITQEDIDVIVIPTEHVPPITVEIEPPKEVPTIEVTPQPPTIQTPPPVLSKPSTPPKVPQEQYPIDQNYFNTLQTHSMAYKYKDHLLLVNSEHKVGKDKSQKLIRMSHETNDKRLFSYWYGYLVERQLTPSFANKFCKNALSYSEGGTLGSIGSSKNYFDFLGSICGREEKQKPQGGGYGN